MLFDEEVEDVVREMRYLLYRSPRGKDRGYLFKERSGPVRLLSVSEWLREARESDDAE